jgi:hypothetical protein
MNIASSFTHYTSQRRTLHLKKEWKDSIEDGYFETVSNSYILPLLEKNGYTLSISSDILAKRLEEFCWVHTYAYMQNKDVVMNDPVHNGIEDDYEWFLFNCSVRDWEHLFEDIQEPGLFDNSPVGLNQQHYLPVFLWRQLDLCASKSYWRGISIRDCYEDEDSQQEYYVEDY